MNPHETDQIALAVEDKVFLRDLRSFKEKSVEFSAHFDQVIDLSFNQSRLNTLATSGSDGVVRIWDLRMPN